MASIEQYSGNVIPHLLMGTAGTAGDLIYVSTGSGMTWKSSSAGTGVANAFIGVLINNTAAGSYGAVLCNGVTQLQKHASTDVIEVGDMIAGTKSANTVGTLLKGTNIGVCVKRSSSDDTYVSVKLIPFFDQGDRGFTA